MPIEQELVGQQASSADMLVHAAMAAALIIALAAITFVVYRLLRGRARAAEEQPTAGDALFRVLVVSALVVVLGLVVGVLATMVAYPDLGTFLTALTSSEVALAVRLTLITTLTTTAICILLGLPSAYVLSRYRVPLASVVDTIIDLPIVLPPLTAGVALLMFFGGTEIGRFVNEHINVVFQPRGIILAQFFPTVTFMIRALKGAFDAVDPRLERVARTLGCTERQAFFWVTVPLARTGLVAGAIMSWARCVGIFGPIVMFCGAIQFKTEVLPVAVFFNMSVGKIDMAVSIAIIMLMVAVVALFLFKKLGGRGYLW